MKYSLKTARKSSAVLLASTLSLCIVLLAIPRTSLATDTCLAEAEAALLRVQKYNGDIEEQIHALAESRFTSAPAALRKQIATTSVDALKTANQTMEFNRIGNLLWGYEAVHYAAWAHLRRILVALAELEKKGKIKPEDIIKRATTNEDGIGFIKGWKTNPAEWATQLNSLITDPHSGNPRVYTSLAYILSSLLRDSTRLKELATAKLVDAKLLKGKEGNQRCNIFQAEPVVNSVPLTTQPAGWPWLKYFTWNPAEKLGLHHQKFIGDAGPKTCTFKGMEAALEPPFFSAYPLQENTTFLSGADSWGVIDQTVSVKEVSANWYQQCQQKGLPMLAGPSSTTSLMYEMARLLQIPANEAPFFRMLMLVWMIQARDHSFAEIMGAFDAYALEYEENPSPATVEADQKMAWPARKTGEWTRAYNGLMTEDATLPALAAQDITLGGQVIKLSAYRQVKAKVSELHKLLTGQENDKCYPSYYASNEYMTKVKKEAETDTEELGECGLLTEEIAYCAYDEDTLEIFDPISKKDRVGPKRERREIAQPGRHFLDPTQKTAFCTWLKGLKAKDKSGLTDAAIRTVAESPHGSALTNTFVPNPDDNPVWHVFLGDNRTSHLSTELCDVVSNKGTKGENCFYTLLDETSGAKTPEARHKKLAPLFKADAAPTCALVQGAMLAAARFYTFEGDSLLNPGYGPFAPPASPDALMSKLDATLTKKLYKSPKEKEQAKQERTDLELLLRKALQAPLFAQIEPDKNKIWHGLHEATAEALRTKLNDWSFPGFMSTSFVPKQAAGWLLQKGTSVQVNTGAEVARYLHEISAAPGELEALIPQEAKLTVTKECVLFIDVGDYPAKVKGSTIKEGAYILEHGKPKKLIIAAKGASKAPTTNDSACLTAFQQIYDAVQAIPRWGEPAKYNLIAVNISNASAIKAPPRTGAPKPATPYTNQPSADSMSKERPGVKGMMGLADLFKARQKR